MNSEHCMNTVLIRYEHVSKQKNRGNPTLRSHILYADDNRKVSNMLRPKCHFFNQILYTSMKLL